MASIKKQIIKNWDLVLVFCIAAYLSTSYAITGNFLSQLLLILIVALGVEKLYVGRTNVIQNIGVIIFLIMNSWNKLPDYLQYYLLGGAGLGIIGVILYLKRNSLRIRPDLKKLFNGIAYAVYSMKTLTGLFVSISLIGLTFDWVFWLVAILTSVSIWHISIRLLEHNPPWNLDEAN